MGTGYVVGLRRGTRDGRGGMSWVISMSWMYVVGNSPFLGHVVETKRVCRGTHACRANTHVVGAHASMSWSFLVCPASAKSGIVCMSWVACRGCMSWMHVVDYITHVVEGCRGHIVLHDMGLVCRGENPPCNTCADDILDLCPRHGTCRGGTSWVHFVLLM